MAVEVNSPDLAEATRALGSLCEEEEEEEEEDPASDCSGPNSRLASAAAGSAVVARSRVELEDAPRRGALTSDTSWAFATDELRVSWTPDMPALDTRSI